MSWAENMLDKSKNLLNNIWLFLSTISQESHYGVNNPWKEARQDKYKSNW